jgi:hypothetical protein
VRILPRESNPTPRFYTTRVIRRHVRRKNGCPFHPRKQTPFMSTRPNHRWGPSTLGARPTRIHHAIVGDAPVRGASLMGRSAKPEETGSTPVRASNWLQWLEWTGARFLLGSMRVRILLGAPIACVAQRTSARVLSGMTLVRLRSQAPMTTPIWRVNRRGLRRRLLSGRSVRR